jgi:hypothetical protein
MMESNAQSKACTGYGWRFRVNKGLFGLATLAFLLSVSALAGASKALEFDCPRVYQGIKSEMLPTYWESTDRGKGLAAGQSQVQGKFLICIYRKASGEKIGNVRRLIPKGYRCITDGRGSFQCESSES